MTQRRIEILYIHSEKGRVFAGYFEIGFYVLDVDVRRPGFRAGKVGLQKFQCTTQREAISNGWYGYLPGWPLRSSCDELFAIAG